MAAYPSLNLPRFSGSTLEPTVEPVAFMPSFSSAADSDDDFLPTPPSTTSYLTSIHCSLKRPNRPTFIDIPSHCKSFSMQQHTFDNEEDDWTPPSENQDYQPEFEWNESEQAVIKRSHHPHHPHIFWSA
ncbi:hypothetical protein BC941DRAFT_498985 [Chlamydoabsidia padenii]|nr:hypothetical protein BC941DRAFT_498985 [Chlamydoabsidia padenii]